MDESLQTRFYKKSVIHFTLVALLYFAVGIALAVIVNKISTKLQSTWELDVYSGTGIQILLTILALYGIETFVSPQFALDWQNTTPGFIFVSMIFAFQPNLIKNIESIIGLIK